MAKRASWRGNFRLGNLTIPVKLYSASKDVGPDFVQVHKDDMAPVKRKLICSKDGEELGSDDVIRAIEHDGKYIPVQGLDEVKPHIERDIIVRQFASVDHVHSLYHDKPYYIAPEAGGEAAYAILRNGLKRANKIAVVTYSLYGQAHLGIIGPSDGILILQELKYANELVDKRDIKMPSLPQPSPGQLDLMTSVIEKYTTDFYLEDYRNEQQDTMNELIERSIKGLPAPKQKKDQAAATAESDISSTFKVLLEENKRTLN